MNARSLHSVRPGPDGASGWHLHRENVGRHIRAFGTAPDPRGAAAIACDKLAKSEWAEWIDQEQIARQDELAGAHPQRAFCASHAGARTGQREPKFVAAPYVKITESRQQQGPGNG